MEKNERNYRGWDMTVKGKKFSDRFYISCVPNMNYVYQLIQNELYEYLALKYAELNNLSLEYQHDREIIVKWTDNAVQEFIEDISTMKVNSHIDFPFTLFCSLEERIDTVMEQAKKRMEDTPLAYYQAFQNDKRLNYRVKI